MGTAVDTHLSTQVPECHTDVRDFHFPNWKPKHNKVCQCNTTKLRGTYPQTIQPNRGWDFIKRDGA